MCGKTIKTKAGTTPKFLTSGLKESSWKHSIISITNDFNRGNGVLTFHQNEKDFQKDPTKAYLTSIVLLTVSTISLFPMAALGEGKEGAFAPKIVVLQVFPTFE